MFLVGTIKRLPYDDAFFDIVTASLIIDYVDDLKKAFREVRRVLKKDGLFFYSDNSAISAARQHYEDDTYKIRGTGYFIDKRSNKRFNLGDSWSEGVREFEMIPGMTIKFYKRTFRTHLKAIVDSGFELVDIIDCKPIPAFRSYDPVAYDLFNKFPIFSIFVCKRK
jgi:ubiquinone/menaquinone biosynthesis C-methylase UbiE